MDGRDFAVRAHRLYTVDASPKATRRQCGLPVGTAVDLAVEGMQRVRGHVAWRRGRDVRVSPELPARQGRAMFVRL